MEAIYRNIKEHKGVFPLSSSSRKIILTTSLLILDVAGITIAFFSSSVIRFYILPYYEKIQFSDYLRLLLLIIPMCIFINFIQRLYDQKLLFGGLDEYIHAVQAAFINVFFIMLVAFILREELVISRGWLTIFWFSSSFISVALRFLFRRFVYFLRRHGHLLKPAIIIGANEEGKTLAEQLSQWDTSGLYLLGFLEEKTDGGKTVNGYRVIGKVDEVEEVLEQVKVEEIIIAPTALTREKLLEIINVLFSKPNVNLYLSSGLYEIVSTGLFLKQMAYAPIIGLNKSRIVGVDALLKSLLDYILSLAALIVFTPIFILLGILIRLDSPGPILYRRRVMGINGSQFDAFKFRTMYINGDEILSQYPEKKRELEKNFKIKDDPRITRIGMFLRKYSLDELPQVINVLLGQMSIVGPRMISPPELALYGKWGMNLLCVKPGITGLWQISGRSDLQYEQRIRLDMQYIRNWTIWLDLYIVLATIPAILKKKGAY